MKLLKDFFRMNIVEDFEEFGRLDGFVIMELKYFQSTFFKYIEPAFLF